MLYLWKYLKYKMKNIEFILDFNQGSKYKTSSIL